MRIEGGIVLFIDEKKKLLSILDIEPSQAIIQRHDQTQLDNFTYEVVSALKEFADKNGYTLLLDKYKEHSNKIEIENALKNKNLFQYGDPIRYSTVKELTDFHYRYITGRPIIPIPKTTTDGKGYSRTAPTASRFNEQHGI